MRKMVLMRISGATRVLGVFLLGGLVTAQVETRPDPVVLFVNDLPVFASEYRRAQLENPAATMPAKSFFKIDRDNLALASVARTQAIQDDADAIEVGSSEVDKEIAQMIKQNDWDFEQFKQNLETAGYSVEAYRRQIRQHLRSERRMAEIKTQIKTTPAELGFFYALFPNRYTTGGVIVPLDAVRSRVQTDVKTIKLNAALENWLNHLMSKAKFRVPENSSLEPYNPKVAKIAGDEIELWTLNQFVYNDAKIINLQMSGGNLALEIEKLKTSTLEQLIDQHIAGEFAKKSGKPFVGSGKNLLEAVKNYQVQNLKITQTESQNYYQANTTLFKTPGSASFKTFGFANLSTANAFREELIRTKRPVDSVASKYTQDRTTKLTQSSADLLTPEVKKVIFDQKLTAIKNGFVSQAAKINSRIVVFFVQSLNPPKVRPYNEIKTQATEKALLQKRQSAQSAWLQTARKNYKLENQLRAVMKDSEARGNRTTTLASQPTAPSSTPEPRTPTPEPDPRIPTLRP
jgi:hypothetical protein